MHETSDSEGWAKKKIPNIIEMLEIRNWWSCRFNKNSQKYNSRENKIDVT